MLADDSLVYRNPLDSLYFRNENGTLQLPPNLYHFDAMRGLTFRDTLFYNPLFLPMVTGQALAAARRLIGDIEAANEARATGGREPMRFGIGLHVGDVTFGNVGTEDRLDFTVIGPAVNRASRLEGMTKALGVRVCASAEFNEVCAVPMKSVGKHRLRGVPQPVEIFTLPD